MKHLITTAFIAAALALPLGAAAQERYPELKAIADPVSEGQQGTTMPMLA